MKIIKAGAVVFLFLVGVLLLTGYVKEQETKPSIEELPPLESVQEKKQTIEEQRTNYELMEKYNSYRRLIDEKSKGLRSQKGEEVEYQQDYSQDVEEFWSILLEFKQFLLENREDLIAFGINTTHELSFIEEQLTQKQRREADKVVLSLPFDKENYSKKEVGLWPFCVHGGGHPEGHGGIDFDLKEGTLVLAAADGVVEEIFSEEKGYNVFISHGSIVTGYIPILDLKVKKGDKVKKGQAIGKAGHDSKGKYFIHFEVNDYSKGGRICPYDFFDDEVKKLIDAWLKDATYPEKSKEPYICNCQEPIPPA